jgi:hypothetical protein
MVWQRTKLGVGVVATGLVVTLGLAVLPVATASATTTTTNSAICTAYNAEQANSGEASGKLQNVMEADSKWPAIQKAALSTFSSQQGAERHLASTLSSASAKLRAAVTVSIQLYSTFESIVKSSKSLFQFERRLDAAEASPKVKAADKVLDSFTKLCGP